MTIAKYGALLIAAVPLLAQGAISCVTENYEVTIIEHCAQDENFCRDVTYVGKNKKTGKSVKLKGSQTIRTCSDGVTPCQMMGWEFFSGPYRYAITDYKTLWVTRNGKDLIVEKCLQYEYR
jgi:hypothetical protein